VNNIVLRKARDNSSEIGGARGPFHLSHGMQTKKTSHKNRPFGWQPVPDQKNCPHDNVDLENHPHIPIIEGEVYGNISYSG
jgi:hypothetical protein